MNRALIAGTLAACLPGLLLAAPALLAGCGKKDDRPSVLVIIVDTLRADYLDCYGARNGATPSMDRLASGGARFSI